MFKNVRIRLRRLKKVDEGCRRLKKVEEGGKGSLRLVKKFKEAK